jgi:TatD DNase family protein
MFDTHCHLDTDEFAPDRDLVLARARARGVHSQLVPAIAQPSWAGIAALCAPKTQLYAAYGLHPIAQAQHRPEHLTLLRAWLDTHPETAAIGEFGLDFYEGVGEHAAQVEFFEAQLRIARDYALPVVLHCRRALDQLTLGLRKFGVTAGVVHSFSGSQSQADALIKRGLHLGIGGPVTYPRAKRLREIVKNLPESQLLLETDAPDQPLCGWQGQRNEPERLALILHAVAELRGVAPAALERSTDANAARLFVGECGSADTP